MKVQLTGRLFKTEFLPNGGYRAIVQVAAPDPYSKPSSYQVVSDQILGQPGQDVSIECELSGFVKEKPYTDKKTNQPKVYWEQFIDMRFLRVVPAAASPRAVGAAASA